MGEPSTGFGIEIGAGIGIGGKKRTGMPAYKIDPDPDPDPDLESRSRIRLNESLQRITNAAGQERTNFLDSFDDVAKRTRIAFPVLEQQIRAGVTEQPMQRQADQIQIVGQAEKTEHVGDQIGGQQHIRHYQAE